MNILFHDQLDRVFDALLALSQEEFDALAADIPQLKDQIWRIHITSEFLARHPDAAYTFPVLPENCSTKALLIFMASIGQFEIPMDDPDVRVASWCMSRWSEIREKFGVCGYQPPIEQTAAA